MYYLSHFIIFSMILNISIGYASNLLIKHALSYLCNVLYSLATKYENSLNVVMFTYFERFQWVFVWDKFLLVLFFILIDREWLIMHILKENKIAKTANWVNKEWGWETLTATGTKKGMFILTWSGYLLLHFEFLDTNPIKYFFPSCRFADYLIYMSNHLLNTSDIWKTAPIKSFHTFSFEWIMVQLNPMLFYLSVIFVSRSLHKNFISYWNLA